MIKRYYFASYVKHCKRGTGSFSWRQFTFHRKSLFAEPEKAYNEAYEHAKELLKDVLGDEPIQCIAFNRI